MDDQNANRREALVKRACRLMGWEYAQSPVWAGLRKAALAEAVVVGLDKLEAMLAKMEDLQRGLEFYANHGHWMSLTEDGDRSNLTAHGKYFDGTSNGWAEAEATLRGD